MTLTETRLAYFRGVHATESVTVARLLEEEYGDPSPRTALFDERPCVIVTYHAPTPVIVEIHHSRPVFLQNRLYGKIIYAADTPACGTCHDSVHSWLYGLLGERHPPPRIGRAAKAEAERTYDWYLSEMERLLSRAGTGAPAV